MPPTFEQLYPFDTAHAAYIIEAKKQNVQNILDAFSTHSANPEMMHYAPVSYLMTEARQLIELLASNIQDTDYAWLRMYCHFVVHARPLDRDIVLYHFLDEMAVAFKAAIDNGGEDVSAVFRKVVPSVFSPSRLRSDLRKLFSRYELTPTFLDDDAAWESFIRQLTYSILWKRILIPPNIVTEEIASMGGLVESTPHLEPPTKEQEPNPLARRARTYFRKMAQTVGFPGGVPIFVMLAPKAYMFSLMRPQIDADKRASVETDLNDEFPGDLCWVVGLPQAQMFAPFLETV